jgi:PAS domain S-box-containing protein
MIFAIGLSAASITAYYSATRWVGHALEAQQDLSQWLVSSFDAQVNARGYVVSGERRFLTSYEQALKAQSAIVDRLRRRFMADPRENADFETAVRASNLVIGMHRDWISEADRGKREEAIRQSVSSEAKQTLEAFEAGWRSIWTEEERLLSDRRALAQTRAQFVLMGTVMLSLACCALLAYAWQLRHEREKALGAMAQEANQRVRALTELAAALAQSRTRTEVVDVIIEQGMRIAQSDTCTIYMLDEAGSGLELLGERGCAPEIISKLRRISAAEGNPEALRYFNAGQALWAETEADYRALFPSLAGATATGPRAQAFWSVPLIVEGRPLGLFAMGFYQPKKFSQGDRSLVEALSNQCAQALVRAMRTEREDQARRWLSTTLRSIGDAVIATDPDGRVTFMNPIAEQLTGFSEAESRGESLEKVFRIFSEQTREPVESPVTRVLREGTVVGLANHTFLHSRSGLEIPIDDSGAPIRNEAGHISGVVMVFRDATPQQQQRVRREFLSKSSEVLVSSLDYQSTLASVARLAVPTIADWCVVDLVDSEETASRQAAVAHVDPAKLEFARRVGEKYPPDPNANTGAAKVIRTGLAELYPDVPDDLIARAARDAEHLQLLRELKLESAMVVPLTGRRRILGAISFIYADSRRRYTEDDLEFAEDFARRAAMAIENAQALKDAESARAQERVQRRKAELASRAKDEFLAVVSHELRTPLNAILGWTVILRGRDPAPNMEHGLAIIERNARAQAKLVEDVLDVSRIISGKLSLTMGKTNLAEVIAASVETVAPAAKAKAMTIVTDVPDKDLVIVADANRVQQIVWNLLSNAVKFTPKGGWIRLNAYRQGSDLELTVTDNGEGIAPAALPFVFEPFQQADSSTTRRHGGLGLGLAIVKHLVTAHGGTITAMSDGEGKGATFRVTLPARAAVPILSKNSSAVATSGSDVEHASGPQLDGLKVLLVDDELDALELVSEVLKNHGAEIHTAASAEEALDRLASIRPTVLLSDIGMPRMDGFSLIQAVRALPPEAGGQTPAVAITAYARREDADRALAAGYQAHVAKPIEPTDLVRVVAELGGRTATG